MKQPNWKWMPVKCERAVDYFFKLGFSDIRVNPEDRERNVAIGDEAGSCFIVVDDGGGSDLEWFLENYSDTLQMKVDVDKITSHEPEECLHCNGIFMHSIITYPKSNGVLYRKGTCDQCNGTRDLPHHNPPEETVLYFGKHKGKPLSDVPTDYLKWTLDNVGSLNRSMRSKIKEVIDARQT